MSYTNLFKKRFTEVFHYYSASPPSVFRQDLDELLYARERGIYPRKNLTGIWLSENQFEITRKWEWGSSASKRRGRTMMYLYGELLPAGEKTHVIISLTNPSAPWSVIGPFFLGLLLISDKSEYLAGWLAGTAVIFGLPILFLEQGYRSKNRLRDAFVEALQLHPAEERTA